jgi:hypothetical protein
MRVRYVSKNTALNPVARAMAQKKLSDALLNHKLKLYMMQDGESCYALLENLAMMMATIGVASELDPDIGGEDVGVRILRGGMSACQALIATDKWDSTQVVAIERALDEAQLLNKRVHPVYIARANAMQSEILKEVVTENENR